MTPVDADGLDVLIADARALPALIQPQRRPDHEARVIDLAGAELRIPATTASLVEEYADYYG